MKFKRKKNTRARGTKTHGWGAMKKHRGSGNRGGNGMAGSGKRADQKKPTIIKLYGNTYFGKFGFKRPLKMLKNIKTLNLDQLNHFDAGQVNLTDLGYNKLLGKGHVTKKFIITVDAVSEKAKQKIEKAGGSFLS